MDEKSIITLDQKHEEMMDEFEKNEAKIRGWKDERDALSKALRSKKYKSVEERLEWRERKKELKKSITQLEKKYQEYYLDNSKYIFSYFENKKDISKDTNKKRVVNNFFNKKTYQVAQGGVHYGTGGVDTKKSTSRESNQSTYDAEDMTEIKKYFVNMDDSYLDIQDYILRDESCERCAGEMVVIEHEGVTVCKVCSYQKPFLIEHEKPSYKEPPKEVCFYAYKRINHFREILAQFQAKESTQIADEVIDTIKKQIKKERITLAQLTNDKTKQILKNLGYNKYYEHIPFIKEKLGIKPPTMSIELEHKLCNLFLEIQQPYAKYCPNERVNFLNYYYVLFKMCELLGEDEYLPHFYMLKDPIKRMEQDEIWKKICKELNWEFITTP